MEVAKQVEVKVLYDSIDISQDISKSLLSLSYIDNVSGKADEIELKLEDTKGLFSNSWYPNKGSRLTVYIDNVSCGIFSIDEINVSGPPDIVTWRGISALITNNMRTKKSKGYESITLLDIAKDIAKNHNLTVDDGTKTITETLPSTKDEQAKMEVLADYATRISKEQNKTIFYNEISALMLQVVAIITSLKTKGYTKESADLRTALSVLQANMEPLNTLRLSTFISKIRIELYREPLTRTRTLGLGLSKIKVARSTQNNETDLSYLSRICEQYGLAFNIKPPLMVFYSKIHLESAPSIITINKSYISSYDITDKTENTFAKANVIYHDPVKNETITNENDYDNYEGGQTNDVLTIRTKVENKEQADAIAKSAIQNHNSKTRTGSISLPGNILLLAGSNFNKVGFGIFDGKYTITSSSHSIDKGAGYSTSIEYKQAK